MDLLPGGYTFTHLIFWTVAVLVAIGTNAVPVLLMLGLAIMGLETAGKE